MLKCLECKTFMSILNVACNFVCTDFEIRNGTPVFFYCFPFFVFCVILFFAISVIIITWDTLFLSLSAYTRLSNYVLHFQLEIYVSRNFKSVFCQSLSKNKALLLGSKFQDLVSLVIYRKKVIIICLLSKKNLVSRFSFSSLLSLYFVLERRRFPNLRNVCTVEQCLKNWILSVERSILIYVSFPILQDISWSCLHYQRHKNNWFDT